MKLILWMALLWRPLLYDMKLIEGILEPIPEEVMSFTQKKWVRFLLLHRKEWLLNWYKGGV